MRESVYISQVKKRVSAFTEINTGRERPAFIHKIREQT